MKKLFFIGLVIVSLALSLSSQATQGKGKMTGSVTDVDTGEPVEGVTVKLFCVKANAFHTKTPKTDAKGEWKAMFLRGGPWHLDYVKVGYETKKISFNVETAPGRRKPSIDITLKKIEGPALEEEVVKEIEIATTLLGENKLDEALAKYKMILEKYKEAQGIAIVKLYVGNIHAMKENYNEAIEFYKQAVEEFPKNKDLLISIGNAYNNLGDYDGAMEWFTKIPFEGLSNMDTLYNIGIILYNKAKYDDAVKYFKKATEVSPDFAEGYYQLGMTYTAQNKIPEALAALKKFMELAPDSPNYQIAKAVIDAYAK